jgi:hypothetical protein
MIAAWLGTEIADDRGKIGAAERAALAQDRLGNFDGIARKAARHRRRGARVTRDLPGDRGARRKIDRVDQTQHQLGVVALFLPRVRGLLYVKIGEHAHERRTDIDAVAPREAVEPLKLGKDR